MRTPAFALFLALGAAPLAAQTVQETIRDAGALIKQGDTGTAIEQLQQADRRASTSGDKARVKNALGFTLYSAGRPDAAASALKEAHDLAETEGDTETMLKASNNLGLVEFGRGDLQAARSAFEQAARQDSEMAQRYLRIIEKQERAAKISDLTNDGVTAVYAKRYGEAIEQYDAALAIDPDNVRLLNLRGYALIRNGDAAAAERDLVRAVELDPEAMFPRINLLKARCVLSDDALAPALGPQDPKEREAYAGDGELQRLCGSRLNAVMG